MRIIVSLRVCLSSSFLCLSVLAAASDDINHGKLLFQQNCSICHSIGLKDQAISGQGPLIAGIVGKPAGSLSDFSYTKALSTSGVIWSNKTLNEFLKGPALLIPGTAMAVMIQNESDRSDLVSYLCTLTAPAIVKEGNLVKQAHVKTLGDYQNDAPGITHQINLSNLPKPYATKSAGNSSKTVKRPEGASLSVPRGFQVKLFASHLSGPRLMRTAPNGDIFIAETRAGKIKILRTKDGANEPVSLSVFAEGLQGPFGIAFYPLGDDPKWLYIATLNTVVRYPYHSGDLKASAKPEVIIPELAHNTGGHSTRDIAFTLDNKRLIISVGSVSNVAEAMSKKTSESLKSWNLSHAPGAAWDDEENRADILHTDPEGKLPLKYYATGVRNAVGIAIQPDTGKLWVSTNERDALGDDLVPDYITHIEEGGFYGWPWYYMGNHEDPRHAGERPDLAGKAIVPDLPVQPHSATLQLTFYPKQQAGVSAFPSDYTGDIFAAFHGSWNRTGRTGSKVIRVHLVDGKVTGSYEDFITGFVVDDGHVWGRPVGVTVAHDGALIVSDDANGTLWRVSTHSK